MYFSVEDLKWTALTITNKETNHRDINEYADRIENDDLKWFAFTITNNETNHRDINEYADRIEDEDLKWTALTITNNETNHREINEYASRIDDDDLKWFAFTITNNETNHRDINEYASRIDDDNLKWLAFAITNNETNHRDINEYLNRLEDRNIDSDITDGDESENTNISKKNSVAENYNSYADSNDSETSYSHTDSTSNFFNKVTIVGGLGVGGAILGLILGFFLGIMKSCNNFDGGLGKFDLKTVPSTATDTMKFLAIAGLVIGIIIVLYDRKR